MTWRREIRVLAALSALVVIFLLAGCSSNETQIGPLKATISVDDDTQQATISLRSDGPVGAYAVRVVDTNGNVAWESSNYSNSMAPVPSHSIELGGLSPGKYTYELYWLPDPVEPAGVWQTPSFDQIVAQGEKASGNFAIERATNQIDLSKTESDQSPIAPESGLPAEPPADWTKVSGGGAEIYLPPYFDWNMKDPTTVSSLQAMGPGSFASQFENLKEPIYVLDSVSLTEYEGLSLVEAFAIPPGPEDPSLEEYVDRANYQVSGAKLRSRTDLTIDGREATRVVVEGDPTSFVDYFVKAPAGVWIVRYAVPSTKLQARLADFDLSANSFRILP